MNKEVMELSEKAREMKLAGKHVQEIADALGTTKSRANYLIYKNGWSPNNQNPTGLNARGKELVGQGRRRIISVLGSEVSPVQAMNGHVHFIAGYVAGYAGHKGLNASEFAMAVSDYLKSKGEK